MAAVAVGEVYFLAVTLLQLSLVYLILRTGGRDWVRAAVAGILGLSGLETAVFFARMVWDLPGFGEGVLPVVDPPILVLTAFVLTQFPTPITGSDDTRGTRNLLAGVLVAWVVAMAVFVATGTFDSGIRGTFTSGVRGTGFAASAVLLAIHLVPKWSRLDPGPLRGQTALVGAGLGVTVIYQAVRLTDQDVWNLLTGQLAGVTFDASNWWQWTSVVFVVIAGLYVVRGLVRDRDYHNGLFTALFAVTAALAVRNHFIPLSGVSEFASQAIRPLFLGAAMLRYDLFQIPDRIRNAMLAICGTSLAVIFFLVPAIIFGPDGFESRTVDPMIATGTAATGVLAALALRDRVVDLLAVDPTSRRVSRLARYRLALERSRQTGDEDARGLEELRRELGVSRADHSVLEEALSDHIVVPTGQVAGPQPGDVVADRYEVRERLGSGGYGAVLLARDRERDRLVALKHVTERWSEGSRRREESLEHEAHIGADLDSDRLPEVHGTATDGFRTYLVRDHVPGRTVDEIVEAEGPLEPERARALAADVLEALEDLHEAGVLHLDLKPSNVVVDPEGRANVIDFGTARRRDREGTRTMEGKAGTAAWMAPEQRSGREVDERTDLFAAGALLLYAVTGEVPLQGFSSFGSGRETPVGLPPAVPEDAAKVIRQALALDPADRFADAAAMREALDAA